MASHNNPSDEELVRTAQQGALEAFAALYERYLPLVYGRVRYVIPEADIEDVTQEVFIAVIRSLPGFRFEASFATWLRTLVKRQVADYYRSSQIRSMDISMDGDNDEGERLVDSVSLENMNAADRMHPYEEGIMLRQALTKLPEHYQEILLLRFVEGLRFEEIARLQGQSLEATKSLFRRAIAMLQKEAYAVSG